MDQTELVNLFDLSDWARRLVLMRLYLNNRRQVGLMTMFHSNSPRQVTLIRVVLHYRFSTIFIWKWLSKLCYSHMRIVTLLFVPFSSVLNEGLDNVQVFHYSLNSIQAKFNVSLTCSKSIMLPLYCTYVKLNFIWAEENFIELQDEPGQS